MLSDQVILLAGLCQIDLPDRTVRLCDGAFVQWGADIFTAEDEQFGTIGSFDALAEAVSDEAPSGKLTMLPPSVVEAGALFQPTAQGSAIKFWLAEVVQSTGVVSGDPELLFSGMLDAITLRVGRDKRVVEIEFVSDADRLFHIREGNVLSPRFHSLAWPGEKGFDHATGVPALVPWGVSGARGTSLAGGGSILAGGSRTKQVSSV